jgi:hypothetical protein
MRSRGKSLPRSNGVLLACLVVLAGCSNRDSGQQPLARIDDRTLTLNEVRAHLDSSRGATPAQVAEYTRRWINDEILYREAVRRGLDNSDRVRTDLEEARRQLAINALLQEDIYSDKTSQFAPEEVAEYFNAHSKEFILTTDVALVSDVVFGDRDAANAFRANVRKGTSWNQAVAQVLADPGQSAHVIGKTDSVYYNQNTLLPTDLWRVAAAAGRPEPSFPVRTNEGNHVLIVWKFSRQGQVADLPYVEREIRSRLTIDRRRRALTSLIETLRSKHAVELMVSDESDTSSNRSAK